jgi:hypothetical protein
MIFNKKVFNKFEEKELGIQVELGDDATYPMTRIDPIFFKMPPCDVLELHDVLFVLGLTKNLLFVSVITNQKCKFEFDD